MRMIKQLLFAGLVSLGLAAMAQAQTTTVYITGSTAFRGATHTAISKRLQNCKFGYIGANLSGAGFAIFEGDLPGSNSHVIVKTSWSGSVGGIQTVGAGTIPVTFIATGDGSNRATSPGTQIAASGTPAGAAAESAFPDVAMADNYTSATPFDSNSFVEQIVGVVDFKFVASKDAPDGLNMTPQLAQALFKNGSLPLSLFTGSSADETKKVWAIGRDPDSGTRVTAFAESGVGVFQQVVQYQPDTQDANGVQTIKLAPGGTVNGIPIEDGNNGYSSGSTLRDVMKLSTPGIGGFFVTYLGLSDATNALGGGAHELTYNGTPHSTANIQNGKYTFWGYEHLIYKNSLSGVKKDAADQIADQIKNTDSPIIESTMRVKRVSDGGVIRPKF